MAEEQQKKILSKTEWFLLIIALGILLMVILQNNGINVIETTEKVEISEQQQRARAEDRTTQPEANTLYDSEKKSQVRND